MNMRLSRHEETRTEIGRDARFSLLGNRLLAVITLRFSGPERDIYSIETIIPYLTNIKGSKFLKNAFFFL